MNLGQADSRSVATPQNDSLSTSAESTGKASKAETENKVRRIPTPLSEEQKDPNIQFVEVQTLLFGDNPAPLNPRTI
jgi:hypothetical protein